MIDNLQACIDEGFERIEAMVDESETEVALLRAELEKVRTERDMLARRAAQIVHERYGVTYQPEAA